MSFGRVRFDFDLRNARGVELRRGATPAQTLERLRRVALDDLDGPGVGSLAGAAV